MDSNITAATVSAAGERGHDRSDRENISQGFSEQVFQNVLIVRGETDSV